MKALFIPFIIFAGIMNVIAFLVFGIDKHYAKTGKWRVKESTLFILSALFGAVGAFVGMRVYHHKTKKPRFRIIIPVLAAAQLAVIVWMGVRWFG